MCSESGGDRGGLLGGLVEAASSVAAAGRWVGRWRGWDGMGWDDDDDEFGGLFSLLIYLRYQPTSMYLMVVRSRLPAASDLQ